jgi:hypothetical protein
LVDKLLLLFAAAASVTMCCLRGCSSNIKQMMALGDRAHTVLQATLKHRAVQCLSKVHAKYIMQESFWLLVDLVMFELYA